MAADSPEENSHEELADLKESDEPIGNNDADGTGD